MDSAITPAQALRRALAIVGTQAKLAAICKCGQPHISKLIRRNRPIPAEFVLRVEAATGVSRHDLRPDIYPVEAPGAPPAWTGVDRGERRVSFQSGGVLQRDSDMGAAA